MLIYCTRALRFSDTGLTLETGIVSCIYYTHITVSECHFIVVTISLIMLLNQQLLPGPGSLICSFSPPLSGSHSLAHNLSNRAGDKNSVSQALQVT